MSRRFRQTSVPNLSYGISNAQRVWVGIQPRAGTIGCEGNTGIERAISHIQLIQPDFPRVILDRRQFSFWKWRAARLRLALEDAQNARHKGDNSEFHSHAFLLHNLLLLEDFSGDCNSVHGIRPPCVEGQMRNDLDNFVLSDAIFAGKSNMRPQLFWPIH